MKRKIVITTGGTGGHIYPAMALAKQLKQLNHDTEILFVGGGLKKNRYFEQSNFPFQEVFCGPLSFFRPLRSLKSLFKIFGGILQSHRLLRDFKPDLVIGFGSYYTFPTLLAAKLRATPIVLHEANRIPGRVNRLLSRHVALTGVHFPDTTYLLKGKVVPAKVPLREQFKKNKTSREIACAYFNLDPSLTTLLIFGGSQGAQKINRMIANALNKLPNEIKNELQILHFTGDQRMTQQAKEQYAKQGLKATVKDFETRMDLAWQSADLMISRSGAGTLAEQLEYEVPGILIPYPYAADNHQDSNADYMTNVIGGSLKQSERELTEDRLAEKIKEILEEDKMQLLMMKESMENYKRGAPSKEFYLIIDEMLGGQHV